MTAIKVGCYTGSTLKNLKRFKAEKLGNFAWIELPEKKEDGMQLARFCKKNKLYFKFAEIRARKDYDRISKYRINRFGHRLNYAKEDLEKVIREGGDYYLGRTILGESGGILYWPKEYLINRSVGEYKNLCKSKDMAEAKDKYIKYIKRGIKLEEKWGGGPFEDVDSSLVFKYHLESGIDMAVLEALPGDPDLMYAALRGASRGYIKKEFGVIIAMSCYGGKKIDSLFLKRFKVSLYFSYLSGANFIYNEYGQFGGLGTNNFGYNTSQCKEFREILRNFYLFCRNNPRPNDGPKVKLGFLHGNLDGYPGLWNKWVWGQFGAKKWQHQAPEQGWKYIKNIYRKEEWFCNTLCGNNDFTGNPPCGQTDIVPVESPVSVLKKYSCLILLGWNTMSSEIYDKLKIYVRNGGHLIMALPHLSTEADRSKDLKLYRNGDYTDLFGVKIKGKSKRLVTAIRFLNDSILKNYTFPNWGKKVDPKYINGGFPVANVELSGGKVLAYSGVNHDTIDKEAVLVENRLGKGVAFLVLSWCYPGIKEMNTFMKEIIRTAIVGEQDDNLKVVASDKIRYSVWEEKGKKRIYLLNTDFDLKSECQLYSKNKSHSFLLKPTELKVVTV